jgi:hypothetical protein
MRAINMVTATMTRKREFTAGPFSVPPASWSHNRRFRNIWFHFQFWAVVAVQRAGHLEPVGGNRLDRIICARYEMLASK